jgi:Zn ribbon nucleic-acid-binding protein
MFVPRYTEAEARAAIASSLSYAEALRKVGLRPAGGNHQLFRRYVNDIWRIPTGHFDPSRASLESLARARPQRTPLDAVLVADSCYSRKALKSRLYEAGLKSRRCELCGQDENWNGTRMSLILDHINGVPDDNRIENLRIVCPNCAATLDTHCGRKNKLPERACVRCGQHFVPRRNEHRYCSRYCGIRHDESRRDPHPQTRKVDRPSYKQLLADLESMSFVAVGRKYGVSDNAVRKWIRWYKHQARPDGPG